MRRLTEILAFPKAWYRRSIVRRLFLGDLSISATYSEGEESSASSLEDEHLPPTSQSLGRSGTLDSRWVPDHSFGKHPVAMTTITATLLLLFVVMTVLVVVVVVVVTAVAAQCCGVFIFSNNYWLPLYVGSFIYCSNRKWQRTVVRYSADPVLLLPINLLKPSSFFLYHQV